MQTTVNIKYQCCKLLNVWSESDDKSIHFKHAEIQEELIVEWWKILAQPKYLNTVAEAWVSEAHNLYEKRTGGVYWKE